MNLRFVSILGVKFLHTTMKEMTERVASHLTHEEKAFIVTANPEIVMKALEDPDYQKVINQATYVVADGIGVVKGAQILGDPLPERVAGYDLMLNLLDVLNQQKLNLYLLGAKEHVLEKAAERIKADYPNLNLVGSHHGFFDWKDSQLQQEMNQLKPDLILVALGLPRQEQWIYEHIDQFDKGVFIGVGGSFDVLAGHVQRAPEVIQKMNLEWFYRLVKEPSRWRRMLALPHFALKVIGQKVKGSK